MRLESVGTILAERILELDDTSGRRLVTVLIGLPRNIPGALDFFCPYQVLGLGDCAVRYAEGVDGAQAVYLAMEALGALLAATPEARSGSLTWYGERTLGFPIRDQRPQLRLVAT